MRPKLQMTHQGHAWRSVEIEDDDAAQLPGDEGHAVSFLVFEPQFQLLRRGPGVLQVPPDAHLPAGVRVVAPFTVPGSHERLVMRGLVALGVDGAQAVPQGEVGVRFGQQFVHDASSKV